MMQKSVTQSANVQAHSQVDEHETGKGMLGPLLCWAVVFADIGTSVYYTPGILYQTVESLAGFFVLLTMIVFVLLTLKYAEVTHRFPQGGGVVTVAAQAINPWFGAVGGMFILVDYFLTAAISSLSGILYLSVVFPGLNATALWVTIGILILLGFLNWIGISESAKVSLVGALIAFLSDVAILVTVFSHLSLADFFGLFPKMFSGHTLTPVSLLAGFAGSFLAFSGLESISQLSPVMKQPHKKVAGIALTLVIITIGLTSPLLTIFATLLLPDAAANSVESSQIISLLAGHWGNTVLQTEVAISASALLVFASNTAIIGAYHVFIALSRMSFLPSIVLQRNKIRNTPHFSIILATGIPILILLLVAGNINLLGDMYAFGLLGAFSLTCLGLDIVRYRELKKGSQIAESGQNEATINMQETSLQHLVRDSNQSEHIGPWFKIDFTLGVITTILVITAWATNLVAKPLATAFGGGFTLLGMSIAYFIHTRQKREGQIIVPLAHHRLSWQDRGSTMAILIPDDPHNSAVIKAAVNKGDEHHPLLFLYLAGKRPRAEAPHMLEIIDPYLDDQQARETFGRAEAQVQKANVPRRTYVYLTETPDIIDQVWHFIHPQDTLLAIEDESRVKEISPDRVRYETTPEGKVAHLLKRW